MLLCFVSSILCNYVFFFLVVNYLHHCFCYRNKLILLLTEQGYSTHKLEFLGLKWAVTDKFKEYLYNGNKCFVFTDNNPLKFLLDKSKIDATSQRWCSELANYNLTVQYKSGVSNVAADALSRLHEDDNQLDEIDGIHEWCKNITVPVCTISTEDVCAVLKEYAY